jgi:hypothetical protein
MQTLLSRPSQWGLVALTLLGLIATLFIRAQFEPLEKMMKASGNAGIVDYELAFTANRAGEILAHWDQKAAEAARQSLVIDYGFMPAYALLFGGITLLIVRSRTERLQQIGLWVTLAPFVAALFDALENAMLLAQLGTDAISTAQPLIAGISASIKFGLLAAALAYWLIAGIDALASRLRRA